MTARRLTAALWTVLLVAACSPAPSASPPVGAPGSDGVDPLAVAIIAQHGHLATGVTTRSPIVIGDLDEQPWSLYLEVSQSVGLDFATLEGRTAELLVTPIAGSAPDAELFLLVVEGRPVGAWIGPGGTSSGVLAVDERP